MNEPVRMQTLGELRLVADGSEPLRGRRKVLALLAYLLAQAPRRVPRAELAALLWGDTDDARAQQSLRQALRTIRGAVGERVEVLPESIRAVEGAIDLDSRGFEIDIEAGALADAVERYRGDFLAGCEDLGGETFRAWVEAERERLRRLCVSALARQAEAEEERGGWAEAIGWLERWCALDPFSEPAHARLVRALRLADQAEAAEAVCAGFLDRLARELDAEPGAEFLRLAGVPVEPRRPISSSSRSAALFTPDLAGRAAEFARLAAAWQAVEAGNAATWLVEGEDGIGKTRLCEELLRWAGTTEPEALVLRARAYAAERETEWAVARDLLSGLADAPGLGGAPDDALAAVGEVVPAIRARFPRLPPPRGGFEETAVALRQVLADVAAEVPVLLFVDDLPLADEPSRRLLLALARRLPARCLLLSSANTAAPAHSEVADALREIDAAERVVLEPLSPTEVEAVLDSMLLLEPGERRPLAQRLHSETRGNPFFLVALVGALADAGHLTRDPQGTWRISLAAGEALPLPGSVREAVEARLRHLAPDAREVLAAAAVLGPTIDPARLEVLAGQPPAVFCDAVEELIARRLLRLAPSRPGHYEFGHDLIRRVTRDRLGPAREQMLLQRAADRPDEPAAATGAEPARPTSRIAANRFPVRGIWRRAAAVAVLMLAVGAASGVAALRGRAPAVSGSLAVLPFEFRGSEASRYLGDGLADLLSVRLDGAGELSSVDPRVLLGAAAQNGQGAMDRERGRAVASRFGAEFYVLGSVVESRGRLQVHAALHGPDGQPLATASALAESEADVPELVDDLARQLLAGRVRGTAAPLARTAAVTTASLPALRAYLDGERLLREGRFGDAATAFAAATEADTAFALAHYRLGVALEWAPADGRWIDAAIDAAMRHADRLPARARLLVEAGAARRRGQINRADSLYQRVLWLSRNDFEAEFHLAEIRFHDRPLHSVSFTTSKPNWRRVLALDPGNGFALVHLARIAASEDSLGAFLDRHAAVVDAVPRDDRRGLELEFWKAIRGGGRLPSDVLDATLRSGAYIPTAHIVGYGRDFAATERLLRELRTGRPTWLDDVQLANVLAAQGRWRAADSLLASSSTSDQAWQSYHRGFLATAAPALTAPWDVARTRQALLRWGMPADADAPHVRTYLLALADAALGDTGALAARAAELERVAGSPLARDLALTLRAESARRQGRSDEALRVLASAGMQASWDQSFNSPFHSRGYLRWLRAETLREQGRDHLALRLYETLGEASPFEVALVAPAYLRRAEIHDRLGERAEALRLFRRFVEMWQDADPELQPLVERARARIRAGTP